MNRLLVEGSSNIKSAGWENNIFEVEFANGSTYRYLNVPTEAYKDFVLSPSKGKFLNTKIKPQFKFEKVIENKMCSVEASVVPTVTPTPVQPNLPFPKS